MSNKKKAKSDVPLPKGLNRLTAEEFIDKLANAEKWGLWVNPAFEEVELIVEDGEVPEIFHGPDPMSIPFLEYKNFCATVDAISSVK